jgi:hypothetical protein
MRGDALEVESAMHITIIVTPEQPDANIPSRSVTVHVPPVGKLLHPSATMDRLVKTRWIYRKLTNVAALMGYKVVMWLFHHFMDRVR